MERVSEDVSREATNVQRIDRSALKLFSRKALRPFIVVVVLLAVILIAYQPASLIDNSWPRFEVLQRSLLWFVRTTAVRSIVGPLILFAGYGLIYWLFVRKRLFIVVSDFRVWGKLAETFPPKGIEARLRDEIMRLWDEMRASVSGQQPEKASVFGTSAPPKAKPTLFPDEGISLPEAYVTLQYEGISLEAIHTFYRRRAGLEIVITGDLMSHPEGLVLAARTADDGPWEVLLDGSDSATLALGLRGLALRILTSFSQRFLPSEANSFVFLQFKALEIKEYGLVVRLAEIALGAAPDNYKKDAEKNLAKAYNKRGLWLTAMKEHGRSRLEFERATEWFPQFGEAWNNLGLAYEAIGEKQKASEAFRRAAEIEQRDKEESSQG